MSQHLLERLINVHFHSKDKPASTIEASFTQSTSLHWWIGSRTTSLRMRFSKNKKRNPYLSVENQSVCTRSVIILKINGCSDMSYHGRRNLRYRGFLISNQHAHQVARFESGKWQARRHAGNANKMISWSKEEEANK